MKVITLTPEQAALLIPFLDTEHARMSREMKEEELPLACVLEEILQQLGVSGYEWS